MSLAILNNNKVLPNSCSRMIWIRKPNSLWRQISLGRDDFRAYYSIIPSWRFLIAIGETLQKNYIHQ